MNLLQNIVIHEDLPIHLRDYIFKFKSKRDNSKQILAIEFIEEDDPFYYAIEIFEGKIITEELYKSGLGVTQDELIFERTTLGKNKTSIKFLDEFENDEKSQVLKTILLEEFVKPNKTIFKLIANRDNPYLKEAKKAFGWFENHLQIITPNSKPSALAHRIDIDENFKHYAEDIMCSFDLGIQSLHSEKKDIQEVFGESNPDDLKNILKKLDENPKSLFGLRSNTGEELIILKENNHVVVKKLRLKHKSEGNNIIEFDLDEESDGTIRLLDFIPAFQDITNNNKVYIIDEIERSIHPLLIKELIKKFADDEHSKGQLIFTTHESNLLDQGIFRQDEIWFTEKNSSGSTDLYSLSDFKEHNTIDIRKGYLNGRYGSIPFLSNLQDLNWHKYDFD
jgi:hypothetical protein